MVFLGILLDIDMKVICINYQWLCAALFATKAFYFCAAGSLDGFFPGSMCSPGFLLPAAGWLVLSEVIFVDFLR